MDPEHDVRKKFMLAAVCEKIHMMKLAVCVFVFANLWLRFGCKSYPDIGRNFYLISVTDHGEIDKYIHYNELTAKESVLKSPSDRYIYTCNLKTRLRMRFSYVRVIRFGAVKDIRLYAPILCSLDSGLAWAF